MSTVVVKWLKSPRARYKIPKAPGTFSEISIRVARAIREDDPDMFECPELDKKKETPPEVKDTLQEEVRTRPVKRAKKD